MDQVTKNLFDAAANGDIEGIRLALEHGADVNAVDASNDTPLVGAIRSCDDVLLEPTVTYLLDHGANPDFRGNDNTGVLFNAALRMNPSVLELLFERGANPNLMLEGNESLYDWSEFTYRYQAFGFGMELPLTPTDVDREPEESWLHFLDRCAQVAGVPPPAFLWVMRNYGAKTIRELKGPAPA
jgi:hypothetical protein